MSFFTLGTLTAIARNSKLQILSVYDVLCETDLSEFLSIMP